MEMREEMTDELSPEYNLRELLPNRVRDKYAKRYRAGLKPQAIQIALLQGGGKGRRTFTPRPPSSAARGNSASWRAPRIVGASAFASSPLVLAETEGAQVKNLPEYVTFEFGFRLGLSGSLKCTGGPAS